jgi:DNA (cytosine-5)-methyltransferase 1
MENVPDLLSPKFKSGWHTIYNEIEAMGYKNYVSILNAKDYGIPQNRNRVFMVSIPKGYYYEFPDKTKLVIKLKDLLEDEVDKKYYLSEGRVDNNLSPTITTKAGSKGLSGQPFIKVPQATKQGYAIAEIGDGIYTNRTESKRGVVQKESVPTIKTSPNDLAVVVDDSNRLIAVRRLTPRECWRLMGWKDSGIDRAFSTGVSETQLYKMAGNSIVVNCLTEIFKRLNEGGKENV